MHVGIAQGGQQVLIANGEAGRLIQAAGIPHRAVHEVIEDGDRDVVHEEAANRFIDRALIPEQRHQCDPKPPTNHSSEHHAGPRHPPRRRLES